jgi:two-component system, cell cycle response regulator
VTEKEAGSPKDQKTLVDEAPHDPLAKFTTAILLIVMQGNEVGRIFALPDNDSETVLGRADDAGIQIMDGEISRLHASICQRADKRYWLSDLGSRNGTTLNGRPLRSAVPLSPGDKIGLGSQTVLRVSHSDEAEAHYAIRMYQAVLRDSMTGAYNRRYFAERLASELAFSHRHGEPVSLLVIDLDHFKAINDNHGHQAGDVVLCELVDILNNYIRREDVLFRYGGEEFVVLCRLTESSDALTLADRLRITAQNHPIQCGDQTLNVTVSIGIATTVAGDTGESLFAAADAALYDAKASGRNRVHIAKRSS